jgi:hypothetical protein
MVSPNLVKRAGDGPVAEINENTKKLFQVIYTEQSKTNEIEEEGTPKIKVSTLISRLAFFYEKIRNVVDYEEEHLLRKNAIARILRRQVLIEGVIKEADSVKIAEHLLIELIRASYLPNNKIPETKIKEVASVLEKYIRLKNQVSLNLNTNLNLKSDINETKNLINQKNKLTHWLLTLAACDIEENLAPNPVKQTIVDNLFTILSKNIQLPADLHYGEDLKIQIYLSISRTYLKFDADMLSFVLFKYYNDGWQAVNSQETFTEADNQKIKSIASKFGDLRTLVDNQLKHPLTKQLDKIVRTYSLYFSILTETIDGNPVQVYNEIQKGEKGFVALLRNVCQKKYHKVKNNLWRAAVRSILYIFLTKSIFAVLIEVPAIHWFDEPLNWVSLAINISFPAILLFLIVFFTRQPKDNNTDKIVSGIKEIVFIGNERKQPLVLRHTQARGWLKYGVFNLIYVASFFVSIYFIIWALTKIQFNWVSITIFLFFLAFVSFFSVITTKEVKELIVVERKENLFTFLLDIFYMPIILVGRWLSERFSRINIFIFLFDFIIESPFKVLVEIAEDWTKYVREQRDNVE